MKHSFHNWLEARDDDRKVMKVLHVFDTTGGAGEAGGDYDRADLDDYIKHTGLSSDALYKKYRFRDDYGEDWHLKQDLPSIEGIHYGYKCAVDAEGDRLLMGADVFYGKFRYEGYYHSTSNSSDIWVVMDSELLNKVQPHIVHQDEEEYIGFIRDYSEYEKMLNGDEYTKMKWVGVTKLIKMITERQEMTPPAKIFSQKWDYDDPDKVQTPLLPPPEKPKVLDPRKSVKRGQGEDAKDWLARAVARQRADYDWKNRTGD